MQKGHGHGGGWEEDKGKAKIYRLNDRVSNGMQEMSLRESDAQYRRRRKRLTVQETVTSYKDGEKL